MATNTYTALYSNTLSTSTASISINTSTFASYKDLILVVNAKNLTGNSDFMMRFNSDTSGSYSSTLVGGDGSSTYSTRRTNSTSLICNYYDFVQSGTNTMYTINIQNFNSSTLKKNVIVRADAGGQATELLVGAWRATPTPITQIDLLLSSSSFAAGSTFAVYGIIDESTTFVSATGGTIYSDATYNYHVFNSSGVFEITGGSKSCNILMVGGGGGGGSNQGGGGGAGGMYELTSQTLLSGKNFVLIGAGGAGSTNNLPNDSTNGSNTVFGNFTPAYGGGRGGTYSLPGNSGGSGGGGSGGANTPGSGTSGQGNSGGSGGWYGAGGGGKTSAANNAVTSNGAVPGATDGGAGATSTISGGSVTSAGQLSGGSYYFAGGGGGGSTASNAGGAPGNGGVGGGGRGQAQNYNLPALAGTANTGGGGGGGNQGGQGYNSLGAAGGSGIVIIKYAR